MGYLIVVGEEGGHPFVGSAPDANGVQFLEELKLFDAAVLMAMTVITP